MDDGASRDAAIASDSTTEELVLRGGDGHAVRTCVERVGPLAPDRSVPGPVHRRGAATGTFFALFDLGIGLGTVIWGYVAAASNYQTMYYFTLVPVALAGLVYFLFTARRGI